MSKKHTIAEDAGIICFYENVLFFKEWDFESDAPADSAKGVRFKMVQTEY